MDRPPYLPTASSELADPGRMRQDAFDAEVGTIDAPEGQSIPSDSTLKTGTTTVGLRTDSGVILATDRRASLGRMVSSKTVQKVEQIHPTAALTIAGSVSAAQSLLASLRAEVSLYEARRGEEMSMTALSTLAGNLLRSGAFFVVQPVLGGVDEEGSHVYSIDPLGATMEENYTVSGSGSQFALGVLEQQYTEDISLEDATTVAARSVESALERDTASGNGIVVATVTDEGVDIDEYEDIDELL